MKKNYLFPKVLVMLIMFTTYFYGQGVSGKSTIANTKIYVDASKVNNNGDGLTWATAKKDIQNAIDISVGGNEIWIKAGVYYPTSHPNMFASTIVTATSPLSNRDNYILLKDNVKIYGGFAGTESLLTERNSNTNITFIDGDIGIPNNSTDNCYHLMIYLGTYSTVGTSLDGLVFRNANAQRDAGSTVVYESTAITVNGIDYGIQRRLGGVYIQQGLNNTFNNIVFENNTAENRGAGLYTDGGYGTTCTYTVKNSYFINNLLSQSTYGAWAAENGKVNCYNTVFYGNKVGIYQYGDGVALFLNHSQSSVINCSFIKNESFSGAALGISADAALPTSISNSIFYGTTRNASFEDTKKYDFSVSIANYDVTMKNCSLENAQSTYKTANYNNLSAASSGNIFAQSQTFANINSVKGADDKYFTADDGLGLSTSSPSKNTGLDSEIPSAITTDITGANRIIGSAIDMGAYEIDGTLSRSNFELNANLQVYPNPTSAILNINMTDFTTAKTTLYDLNGKVLKTQVIDNINAKIDISYFSKGIYLLKMETENGSITKQIIKD